LAVAAVGPSEVTVGASVRNTARPKSRIFTPPSVVRKMFSGFRSRCTIPRPCAAARPSAAAAAMVTASRHDIAPFLSRTRRFSPCSSSMTAIGEPSTTASS
jgi:hypothetical protein